MSLFHLLSACRSNQHGSLNQQNQEIVSRDNHEKFCATNRGPPPPYSSSSGHQVVQPENVRQNHQKRLEVRRQQYRNPIPDADSEDSEDDQKAQSNRRELNQLQPEVVSGRRSFIDCFQFSILTSVPGPDLVNSCDVRLAIRHESRESLGIENFTAQLKLHNEVGLPHMKKPATHHSSSMGQNVSFRRPKISLTWVLREQQSQSQSQLKPPVDWTLSKGIKNEDYKKLSEPKDNFLIEKYYTMNGFQAADHNNPPKNLQDVSKHKTPKKMRTKSNVQKLGPESSYGHLDVAKSQSQTNLSKRNTYSEPSIYITSTQSESRAMVKKYRRTRKRPPKLGYNIKNVDEFLSKCSLSNPANIPVVLSTTSILYQTRTGYNQIEIPLPLGMVVNSIFKNQNWLYVQTPHGEEGYVNFTTCLPLGIIPNQKYACRYADQSSQIR